MLIQNYGLFWRLDRVFWERGRVAGHLKGVLSTRTTSEPVDFRNQQGIYVLYDDSFKIVHIGQSGRGNDRLLERIKIHTRDQLAERWSRFSWFGIRRVLQTGELSAENQAAHPRIAEVLNHIEAILLATAEPPHNRQGGRFGEAVSQFLQVYDHENLGPTQHDMIAQIHADICDD